MKSYRTLNIILISTCLLIDFCIYIIQQHPELFRSNNKPLYNVAINKLKPIDSAISTTLPYSKYSKLKRHQHAVRVLKNGDYNRVISNLIDIVGVGRGDILCDTCIIQDPNELPETNYYYISLRGWKLKSTTSVEPELDSVIFHVENGQSYIRKNVIETINSDGIKTYRVETKDIPVKFKYSHHSHLLKIPVSEQTAYTLKPIITTFNILLFIFALVNIILFIQIISRLIKLTKRVGNITSDNDLAFSNYNILRLRVLAYSFTFIPIFFLLLNLVMRLVFNSYFTGDVLLNRERLYPWWITLHVGILFLLILNVFMQGKALKDEQDLTV